MTPLKRMLPRSRWRIAGGYLFACPPDSPAEEHPALWSPTLSATTVIIDQGISAPDDFSRTALGAPSEILNHHRLADGRHLVVCCGGQRHRLWIRDARTLTQTTFVVPADESFPVRIAATERFERAARGTDAGRQPSFRLTRFKRHRLLVLLRIAQALFERASVRAIARHVTFPHMPDLSPSEWKGSSERRHTQRLIRDANDLTGDGYRMLLQMR